LTVVFEDLIGDPGNRFDSKKSIYRLTEQRLHRLAAGILRKFRDSIFTDPHDPSLSRGVVKHPIRTLPYFHNEWIQRTKGHRRSVPEWLRDPFTLSTDPGGIVRGPTLSAIRDYLNKQEAAQTLPTCVFAEVDTFDKNLRVAVIPKHRLHTFFVADIRYYRRAVRDSSCGILSRVLGFIPKHYNMWRIYNNTLRNDPGGEEGRFRIVVQDLAPLKETPSAVRGRAESLLAPLFSDQTESTVDHVEFRRPDGPVVRSLDPDVVLQEVNRGNVEPGRYEYDVFISHHVDDFAFAESVDKALRTEGLHPFLAPRAIETGDQWAGIVKEGLLQSRELCLIWGKETERRQWVTTEWGVAWALDKRIVPILIDGMGVDALPDRVKMAQAVRGASAPSAMKRKLRDYARAVKRRRDTALRYESAEDI
jgi:hypothetical protein